MESGQVSQVMVTVWGDSHVGKFHHLPEEFTDQLASLSKFSIPKFNAKGGAKIDFSLVQDILSCIKAKSGQPQIHILLIGGNNITQKQESHQICELFEQVLSEASCHQFCFIVLGSIVPRPKVSDKFLNDFQVTSNLLHLTAKKFPSTSSFFDIDRLLNAKNPQLLETLYHPDKVHLNPIGASLLAQGLRRHLSRVPNKNFGLLSVAEKKALERGTIN